MVDRVKMYVPDNATDKQVLELVRQMPNGGYCVEICRGCGMYYTHPEADTKKAIVIDMCKLCFKNSK